jgi:hypothetical protein
MLKLGFIKLDVGTGQEFTKCCSFQKGLLILSWMARVQGAERQTMTQKGQKRGCKY